MSPATVGTSTNYNAVSHGFNRKGFHAEGLFWAFYSNGVNAGWEFTNDPTNWAGAFTSIGTCDRGYNLGIWFDGTFVHYVRYNQSNYDLYYRRGTPVNDGTINWSAAEQLVYAGTSSNKYWLPSLCVDTNGYAWIGAVRDRAGGDFPAVLKNNNNDGTWAQDFAYELNAVSDLYWRVCPIPLTAGKVYVIYPKKLGAPLGRLWSAGWGAEESNLADYNITDSTYFSAVALGDDVHFVYNSVDPYDLRHNERVWGVGWNANDVQVYNVATNNHGVCLSVDPSTGDLFCFWTQRPTADHVYYKRYAGGVWDASPTDWLDETVEDIKYDYMISSFYMDYGGYIGLLYTTKLSDPYNVRFAFLQMPSTSKISGVTDPAEVAGVAAANIARLMGVEFVP